MATNIGGGGDDKIVGKSFSDKLFGGGGKDTLLGGGGGDKLNGGGGSDKLGGGKGKDTLKGGGGKDTLDGGKGNDTLVGGGGKDTFVFKGKFGKDTIKDFKVKADTLKIKKAGKIKDIDDVISKAKQVGKDVVIDMGGGKKIVLKKVDLDLFKAKADKFIDLT
jgi:serralysin